jgi:hypothetical protein
MCKSDIGLPKRALLDASKPHPGLIQQKVLKNSTDILEMDLTLGHQVNGDNGEVLMAARSTRHHHPMNGCSSFNMLELKTSWNKWPRIDGNVCHDADFFSRVTNSVERQRGRGLL